MKKEKKIIDFSAKSIARGFLLLFLPLLVYTISLFPIIYSTIFFLQKINFINIFHILLLTLFLIFEFILFIILETFISGIFIRILRVKVKPGEHELNIKNKEFFNHALFFTLYRPSLKLITIIPLVPLRIKFLKLVGLKIGKNSILAGTELIDEPFSVTIGDNTLIGGMSIIFTHLSHKKMIHKPVFIGNNCFIGNNSVIMPGVTIENNVILEPNSVVEMNQTLKKNIRYSGNPARKIRDGGKES